MINKSVKFDLKSRFLSYSLIYFLILAIQQSINWPLISYWGMGGPIKFWDTSSVLKISDCYSRVGLSVYSVFNGNECSGYMYGRNLLRILSLLNIDARYTNALGWSFLTLLAIIFGFLTYLLNPPNLLKKSLVYLIFLSPPISLLIERANFDALIFILFIGAVIGFSYWASFPSFLIILLISTWKFYTLPLAVFIFSKIKKPYLRIIGMGLFAFAIIQVLQDLQRIPNISVAVRSASFGSQIWGNYLIRLGITINTVGSFILGLAIFILCLALILIVRKRFFIYADAMGETTSRQSFSILLFQSSFLILISCYLAGVNYDYRLIFLCVTSVGFLLLDERLNRTPFSNNLVWILTLMSLWFSYNSGLLEPLGDVAITILVCLFSIDFWKVTTQDFFLASKLAKLFSKIVCRVRSKSNVE